MATAEIAAREDARLPSGRNNKASAADSPTAISSGAGFSGFRPGLSARGEAALVRGFAKIRPAALKSAVKVF